MHDAYAALAFLPLRVTGSYNNAFSSANCAIPMAYSLNLVAAKQRLMPPIFQQCKLRMISPSMSISFDVLFAEVVGILLLSVGMCARLRNQ